MSNNLYYKPMSCKEPAYVNPFYENQQQLADLETGKSPVTLLVVGKLNYGT